MSLIIKKILSFITIVSLLSVSAFGSGTGKEKLDDSNLMKYYVKVKYPFGNSSLKTIFRKKNGKGEYVYSVEDSFLATWRNSRDFVRVSLENEYEFVHEDEVLKVGRVKNESLQQEKETETQN